ncbi:hypothetical protein TrRE_jg6581 [Triparma retinervis]|uniref:Uncharacterized protein n=1 Tax=Triparma retinervis TaxID=2557542 RepID=A0A9W7L206_9STRA|nr:hypothetical protein TrRE_jg6581 [Triparma retinervis]
MLHPCTPPHHEDILPPHLPLNILYDFTHQRLPPLLPPGNYTYSVRGYVSERPHEPMEEVSLQQLLLYHPSFLPLPLPVPVLVPVRFAVVIKDMGLKLSVAKEIGHRCHCLNVNQLPNLPLEAEFDPNVLLLRIPEPHAV